MKALFYSGILLATSVAAYAQKSQVPDVQPIIKNRINTVYSHRIPAYTVIQSAGKQYNIAPDGLKLMKAEWVTTTKVLKDSASTAPYGAAGKKGVSVCVLDDSDHPEAFKKLKPWLTPLKS
ncbi:hypothetical protein ABDD95_13140 [Mucilaginibacter sp. PAMB04274]|uniref:hypothetical protein n=1 Tax=Mucilaginibacter sp. PAMB04274 TaxID=3138568 RepID=UPI0031F6B89B